MSVLVLVLAGCASGSTRPTARPTPVLRPTAIIPAPAGLTGATAPAPNGVLWVLAGDPGVRTIHQIDVASHADLGTVPVPSSATAVAETASGILGVGLATPTTGAVELRDGATGTLLATVPVVEPVRALAVGGNGATMYVLGANDKAASVSVLDTVTDRVLRTVPMPLQAVAAVPNPSQGALWVLQTNGIVDQVALSSGSITTQFSIGNSGRALALSPNGATLYVLKGRGLVRNVAVVDLATESVMRVLPAPASALGLVLSPDGRTLYDIVGTPTLGNIQAFPSGAG